MATHTDSAIGLVKRYALACRRAAMLQGDFDAAAELSKRLNERRFAKDMTGADGLAAEVARRLGMALDRSLGRLEEVRESLGAALVAGGPVELDGLVWSAVPGLGGGFEVFHAPSGVQSGASA